MSNRAGPPAAFAALAATLVLVASAAFPARAADPHLVRLFQRVLDGSSRSSFPSEFATSDGVAFFTAEASDLNRGLWRSDGTAEGTYRLVEICPGNCATKIAHAVDLGDRILLFLAPTGSGILELWVSDGTTAGTVCLLDEFVLRGASILGATGGGSVLFFVQRDDRSQDGLWASDGTPEGTRLVRAFDRDAQGDESIEIDGGFVFTADGGVSGHEPWRTDGTAAGTFQLRDVQPGPEGSFPRNLIATGDGTVFFTASSPAGGGLWRTDGTAGGTILLAEPSGGGQPTGLPEQLAAAEDRLFYIGRSPDGLWVSDGSPGGTSFVHALGGAAQFNVRQLTATDDRAWVLVHLNSGEEMLFSSTGTPSGTVRVDPGLSFQSFGGPPFFRYLATGGERAYFVADDGGSGFEPWVSDGTPAGTHRLADACPGPCSSTPEGFRHFGDDVYFYTTDDFAALDLWATDGTAGGTRRLVELCPEGCHAGLEPLLRWRGDVYFRTSLDGPDFWKTDGTPEGTVPLHDEVGVAEPPVEVGDVLLFAGGEAVHGTELWRTDGTAAGTRLLRDLAVTPAEDSPLGDAAALPGRLLQVVAAGLCCADLWSSDGTPQGTVDLTEGQPRLGGDPFFGEIRVAGDRAWFAVEETGSEFPVNLWITDGRPAGTRRLTDFDGVTASLPFPPRILGLLGDRAFFFAAGQLWTSDGTAGGTRPVTPLREHYETHNPPSDHVPAQSGTVRGLLAFGAREDANAPARLWRTDGTAGGTRPLGPAEALAPYDFVAAGSRLYFRSGDRVWVTDGTDGGTRAVSIPFSREPRLLAAVGGRLYFAGTTATGEEPWTSDGTGAGTRRVADLHPGNRSSTPREFRPTGDGRVYFVADDGVHGRELWLSDGTAAGTRLVADLAPGPHSSDPSSLVVTGGRLLFSAHHPAHGREVWESDGTASGTVLAAELAPGPASSRTGSLRVAGDHLFFHGDDGRTGRSLWALPLRPMPAAPPPLAPAGLTVEGSFGNVELAWQDRAGDEAVYVVEWSTPEVPWRPLVLLPPDTEEIEVFRPGDLPMTFRVRAENAGGPSPPSNPASITFVSADPPCEPDGRTLCLLEDRFLTRVHWRDQRSGDTGVGRAVPYPGSDRTGTFSFFDPENVELIVKTLDGRPVNGAFWSFFGALSDVEYWVTVYDTHRRRSRTYYNPPGRICGVGDTAAFPESAGSSAPGAVHRRLTLPPLERAPLPGSAGACQPGPETLCLLDGRLEVEVAWNDHHNGGSGPGRAVPGTGKTGYFWFFNQDNVELVVKALDGTPVNGHLWVFWGALTDVEHTITVTDLETGAEAEYHNPPGEICGGADTSAF